MAQLKAFKIGEDTAPVSEFVRTKCLHPIKIRQYDYNLRRFVEVHRNCGHCDNCQYKLQQRWLERMETHCLTNKYCYFVTLTYDSKFLMINEEYQRELNCFTGADGRPVPLTLCQTHVRDFLNRLRKQTQKYGEFSYFGCAEYGDAHCRPHFHLLLWSKDFKLSHYNIRKAWSLASNRIGIVFTADLHSNGTFGISKEHAKAMHIKERKSTFGYVCKYIRKYKRFMKAPYEAKLREKFESLHPDKYGNIKLNYRINVVNYAKNCTYLYSWEEFKEAYKPWTFCSTRHVIGGEYFFEHFDEFARSSTRRVTLPSGSDVQVSGYYAKAIKKRLSPFYSKSAKSNTYTSPFDYQGTAEKMLDALADPYIIDFGKEERVGNIVHYQPPSFYRVLKKFYDPVCACWYILKRSGTRLFYEIRKYDKILRDYVLQGCQDFKDFCSEYIQRCERFFNTYVNISKYVEKLDDIYYDWVELSARLSGVTYECAELCIATARSAYVDSLNVAQQKYYAAKAMERKVRPIYNRLVV